MLLWHQKLLIQKPNMDKLWDERIFSRYLEFTNNFNLIHKDLKITQDPFTQEVPSTFINQYALHLLVIFVHVSPLGLLGGMFLFTYLTDEWFLRKRSVREAIQRIFVVIEKRGLVIWPQSKYLLNCFWLGITFLKFL